MKHKSYKVRWNRILVAILIPIVFVFLIYFGIIKGNRKNILKEIEKFKVQFKDMLEQENVEI